MRTQGLGWFLVSSRRLSYEEAAYQDAMCASAGHQLRRALTRASARSELNVSAVVADQKMLFDRVSQFSSIYDWNIVRGRRCGSLERAH